MISRSRKLPLYIGIAVFVMSVLISAIKIGERNSVAQLNTRASVSSASLSLIYSAPDTVNVYLTAPEAVSGADLVLKYDDRNIKILASTLKGGPDFSVTGGDTKEGGLFSFSALTIRKLVTNGLIATFQVQSLSAQKTNSQISFALGNNQTTILNSAGNSINFQTKSLDLNI